MKWGNCGEIEHIHTVLQGNLYNIYEYNESINEWYSSLMDDTINVCMNEWMNTSLMNEWMIQLINGVKVNQLMNEWYN